MGCLFFTSLLPFYPLPWLFQVVIDYVFTFSSSVLLNVVSVFIRFHETSFLQMLVEAQPVSS